VLDRSTRPLTTMLPLPVNSTEIFDLSVMPGSSPSTMYAFAVSRTSKRGENDFLGGQGQ
jgi:hypothetical protein